MRLRKFPLFYLNIMIIIFKLLNIRMLLITLALSKVNCAVGKTVHKRYMGYCKSTVSRLFLI